MNRHLVGAIYVLEAKKEAVTEFWAAATLQEDAVAAVERELGPGWTVSLTDRRLTVSAVLTPPFMTPNDGRVC